MVVGTDIASANSISIRFSVTVSWPCEIISVHLTILRPNGTTLIETDYGTSSGGTIRQDVPNDLSEGIYRVRIHATAGLDGFVKDDDEAFASFEVVNCKLRIDRIRQCFKPWKGNVLLKLYSEMVEEVTRCLCELAAKTIAATGKVPLRDPCLLMTINKSTIEQICAQLTDETSCVRRQARRAEEHWYGTQKLGTHAAGATVAIVSKKLTGAEPAVARYLHLIGVGCEKKIRAKALLEAGVTRYPTGDKEQIAGCVQDVLNKYFIVAPVDALEVLTESEELAKELKTE